MEITTTEQQEWTVLSLLEWSSTFLLSKGFESPRLTTELLLSNVLRCSRIDLYLNFDKPVSADERAQFKRLFQRRLSHEPIQYLLGGMEFMGLSFTVDRSVLIPRPETEVLVEQALALSKDSRAKLVLDIGTGSGNIAISIAHYLPECTVDAVDVSREALLVAEKNVSLHHLAHRVHLFTVDILQADAYLPHNRYDLIVANPPYVSSEEFELLPLEVKDFEPRLATTDGGDGLTFFRAIAERGQRLLNDGCWLVVEVAYNQSEDVKRIFELSGCSDVRIAQDHEGIPRIVMARRASG